MSAATPHDAPTPEVLPESTALDQTAIDARAQEAKAVETPPPPDDKDSKKVVASVQKRIDELTRLRHDAERQAKEETAHWQRQAYEQFQQNQKILAEREALKLQSSEPTLEGSGNDFEKYLTARTAWEAQKNQQAVQAQLQAHLQQQGLAAQQEQQRQYQAAQQQQHFLAEQQFVKTKMAEGAKTYKDFEAVVTNPELPQLRSVNPSAYQAILQSDKGIDVAYYLAKNPLLAHKIALAEPMRAVLEIGRIEGMFASGKRVSDAPTPPTQVGHQEAVRKTAETMSMDEYVASRKRKRS